MNKTALCIPLILFTLPVYAEKTSYNKPEYWRLIHSNPAQGKSIYGNTFVRSLSPGNSMIEIRYEKPKPIIPNETINGRSRIIGKDYVKTRFKFQIDCKNKEISYEESAFFDSKGKLSAYEILPDEELGLGNSIHVNAYRIAALVPGSLSLILADRMPWGNVFIITALFMLPGLLMTLFLAKEPDLPPAAPRTLVQTVVEPFQEFFSRKGTKQAALVLLFIFLYKLGDSMATSLATPFYLDMGFSKTDIGLIAKNAGLWPAVIAGILGGIWMLKLGINKALWLFGVVQVVTILGFVWLAGFGRFDTITLTEQMMLAGVIGAEAVGVGLGTAAFVSYMARETNPAFTATQLALFTSLSAVPRTFINATTGYLIEWLGYVHFFWLCFILALPGMFLLLKVAPWGGDKPTN